MLSSSLSKMSERVPCCLWLCCNSWFVGDAGSHAEENLAAPSSSHGEASWRVYCLLQSLTHKQSQTYQLTSCLLTKYIPVFINAVLCFIFWNYNHIKFLYRNLIIVDVQMLLNIELLIEKGGIYNTTIEKTIQLSLLYVNLQKNYPIFFD